MVLILVLILLIAIITNFYFRQLSYWKARNITTLPTNPFFGNLTDVILRRIPVYNVFNKAYQESKSKGYKYIGFYVFWKPILLLIDPSLIMHILSKDFSHFTDREFYLNEDIDTLSANLVSMRGSKWKTMRETMSPAFTPLKLKTNFQIMVSVGSELISVLDEAAESKRAVNLGAITSRYMADLMGVQIFGIDCNTLKNLNLEFLRYATDVFGGSFAQNIKFSLCLVCPSVMDILRIPFNRVDVQKYYTNLTRQTVEHREMNNIVRKDLLHSLIQLRNNVNIEDEANDSIKSTSKTKALSIQEIAAELMVFSGASFETSLNTASFCTIELLCNHSILGKLKDEIRIVMEKHDNEISYAALGEMSYLEMCVLETLRKYPQLAMLPRICTKRYELPDYGLVVEEGTRVYVPVVPIHADPDYYPDPEKFDPDRFLPENKNERPPYTFLGFGEGPRNCIGLRIGVIQVKFFLALIFAKYNISISPKSKTLINLNDAAIVKKLKEPFYLNLEKIK